MNKVARELMKAARKKSHLKQADLAAKLKVQGSTISNWENGVAEPDIETFVEFCRLCGADFAEILTIAYGDPTEQMETIECTPDEIEMIRKFRCLDRRGQRNVLRNLNAEYDDIEKNLAEDLSNAGGVG